VKECRDCKTSKDLSAFGIDKSKTDGLSVYCKACRNAKAKVANADGRWKTTKRTGRDQTDSTLKHRYGITNEDRLQMIADQNGECAICKRSDVKLFVDHDHKTLEVRGMLCPSCNRALGIFQDSPDLLRNAIDYLQCKPCHKEKTQAARKKNE